MTAASTAIPNEEEYKPHQRKNIERKLLFRCDTPQNLFTIYLWAHSFCLLNTYINLTIWSDSSFCFDIEQIFRSFFLCALFCHQFWYIGIVLQCSLLYIYRTRSNAMNACIQLSKNLNQRGLLGCITTYWKVAHSNGNELWQTALCHAY